MTTLLAMRSLARIKADQTNSTFPTDAEYNSLINEAMREVYSDMIMSGLDVAYTTQTLTVTNVPVGIASGAEVMSVIGVYYVQGSQYYELKRVNPGHISLLRSVVGGYPEFYEVRHNFNGTTPQTLEVFPPQSGATIAVDYIALPAALVADTDTWNGPTGSDDLIVYKAAAAGLRKEGADRDAYELDKQYAARFEKVMMQVNRLDGRNGHQIRDSRGKVNYRLFDYQAVGPNGSGYGF